MKLIVTGKHHFENANGSQYQVEFHAVTTVTETTAGNEPKQRDIHQVFSVMVDPAEFATFEMGAERSI